MGKLFWVFTFWEDGRQVSIRVLPVTCSPRPPFSVCRWWVWEPHLCSFAVCLLPLLPREMLRSEPHKPISFCWLWFLSSTASPACGENIHHLSPHWFGPASQVVQHFWGITHISSLLGRRISGVKGAALIALCGRLFQASPPRALCILRFPLYCGPVWVGFPVLRLQDLQAASPASHFAVTWALQPSRLHTALQIAD